MRIANITKDDVDVTLAYNEIFMLLQCITEATDRMSAAEINMIMDVDLTFMDKFAEQIRRIKSEMENLYEILPENNKL